MNFNEMSLLTDLYELTMMQGYCFTGLSKKTVVFDLFYRKNPSGNGFAIVAGLEQAIDYIKNLKFSKEDIDYLKSLNIFNDEFITYLENFKFSGEKSIIDCGCSILTPIAKGFCSISIPFSYIFSKVSLAL